MLIDIGCQKNIDVFLIKFLYFLPKNSIKNYNTLYDINSKIYTTPWNQSCDTIIETPNHASTLEN